MHLVGWEKIIRPKDEGDLGIQSGRAKNIALLEKLNWRIYQEKEAVWARILLNKHCSNSRRRVANLDVLPSSPNWSTTKLGFPTFVKGICWGVGNGSKKSVWIDNWIKGQCLRELIEGPLTRNDMNLAIANIRDNHEWNWENLSFALPPIIKDKIRVVPCQEFSDEKDVIMWKHMKDGVFIVNSAYLQIIGGVGDGNPFKGNSIWKMDTFPKIVSFLRLCLHNSIPVWEVLATRGINCSKLCLICKEQDESIEHLLRECIFSQQFWVEIHAPRVPSMLK